MLLPLVRPPDCGSPNEFRLDLFPPNTARTVPIVRHLLRDLLAALGLESATPCLLLSELLGNALRYGGNPTVALELRDDQLYIAVADSSPTPVEVLDVDPTQEGGRGLFLVNLLATEWGVEPIGTYGKAVWATAAVSAV